MTFKVGNTYRVNLRSHLADVILLAIYKCPSLVDYDCSGIQVVYKRTGWRGWLFRAREEDAIEDFVDMIALPRQELEWERPRPVPTPTPHPTDRPDLARGYYD